MTDDQALRELGAQILRRRERMQMSQDALAESAGLSKNYIGQIERGQVNPSYLVLLKLARALDCQVADFFPDPRYGIAAESMALAKLIQDSPPAVRQAVVTLLMPRPQRRGGK